MNEFAVVTGASSGLGRCFAIELARRGINTILVALPGSGGKNFVAVQDVARCAVAALSKGTPGKEYLLCGENMSYKDFFRLLASRTDSRGMMIKVPGALLKMAGRLGSALEKGLHIRNEFNSRNMEMLRIGNYYRSDRAAKELGFSCRPVSEAVDEAIGWFRKEKIIR